MNTKATYKAYIKTLPNDMGYIGLLVKKGNKERILRKTNNHSSKELAITELNKHIESYNQIMGAVICKKLQQDNYF